MLVAPVFNLPVAQASVVLLLHNTSNIWEVFQNAELNFNDIFIPAPIPIPLIAAVLLEGKAGVKLMSPSCKIVKGTATTAALPT